MTDLARVGVEADTRGLEKLRRKMEDAARGTQRMADSLKKMQKDLDRTSREMRRIGRGLSLYVTTPLLAAGAATIKFGVDFDSTLSKMNTLVGVSRKELQGFRKDILNLAPSVGRGPIELADAMFAITSAGQRGAQAIATLEQAAKASAIGLGDTRQVALASVAAVQAYGEANLSASESVEILVGTIEQGNLAAEQLTPVIGRVIGLAANMGVEFSEVGAFIATYSRLGIDAAEATTALQSVLNGVLKTTPQVEETFAELGMTVGGFREAIREDFIGAFQDLVSKAKETDTNLASLIPNVRALSGALGVFGGDGQVAQDVLDGINGAVGTLEERFRAALELDPSLAIAALRAEMERLFINISRDLLPIFLELVEMLQDAASWFSELDDDSQRLIMKSAGLVAALGPLLLILGGLGSSLSTLIGLFARMTPVLAAVAPLLLGPVGIVAGLSALAVVLANEYRLHMEGAIGLNYEMVRSLEELDTVTGLDRLGSNLEKSIEQLAKERDALKAQWLELEEQRHTQVRGKTFGTDTGQSAEMERVMEELRELDALLETREASLERVRQKQLELLVTEMLTNEATDDAARAAKEAAQAEEARATAIAAQAKAQASYNALLDQLKSALNPVVAAQIQLQKTTDKLNKAEAQGIDVSEGRAAANSLYAQTIYEIRDAMLALDSEGANEGDDLLGLAESLRAMQEELDPSLSKFNELQDKVKELKKLLENGLIDETEYARMVRGFASVTEAATTLGDVMVTFGGAFEDVIRSIQAGTERGSDEYKKLELAVQATNIVQAIGAILNQAQGDPYTAPARMAAMAAIVSSLVGSIFTISGMSGGADDPTADRQAAQGTGTVLGDAEAKSESIVNSLEIVADATSTLVGINRGMLRALTNLADSITGATTLLAKGIGDLDFGEIVQPSSIIEDMEELFLGFSLFGGSAKLADAGISIEAGSLSQLVEGALIKGFQDVAVKKNIFDDTDIERNLAELDGEVQKQFGLVFTALIDTVTEAALVLGVSLDDIEQRLATFQVRAQDISFEDLTAEEQEAELQAFFGTIFDDLAQAVVPFVEQFQKIGEGLGETLVRVATSIQVFDVAVEQLGITAERTGNEQWAQLAVALVEAVGGLDVFIDRMTTFVDLFASEEHKFELTLNSLTSAFEQAGLSLPAARDGVWDLMRAQDAATESGRQRIALLLELGPLLSEYYDTIEERERERINIIRQQESTIRGFLGGGPPDALIALKNAFVDAMNAAKGLNASTREYALILRKFQRDLRRFSAELTISVIQQSQTLFGEATNQFGAEFENGFEGVRQTVNSVFAEWQTALKNIRGFADDVLLNENLTTLSPAERLAESRRQFERLLSQAKAGDVEAAGQLPGAAQAFLEAARFMFASSAPYQQIFNEVQDALRGVEMPPGIEEYTQETAENTGRTVTAVTQMQNAVVSELQKMLQAMDLSETLRDLGFTLEESPLAIADRLGVPLDQLAEALGIDLSDASRETLDGLIDMAQLLGADLFNLGDVLGVDIQGLADAFDVSLSALDFDSMFTEEIDYLSSIDRTLMNIEAWLNIVWGNNQPGDLERKNPIDAQLGGPRGPAYNGPSATSSSNSVEAEEDSKAVVRLFTQMRDEQREFQARVERQNQELVNNAVEQTDLMRMSKA